MCKYSWDFAVLFGHQEGHAEVAAAEEIKIYYAIVLRSLCVEPDASAAVNPQNY